MVRQPRSYWTDSAHLAVVCAFAIALSGCIFSTRDPNPPPSTEANVEWKNPTEPATVLQNLKVTFGARTEANWGRSLTDDFSIVPDPSDVAEFGSEVFANWSKAKESQAVRDFLQSALAAQATASLTWTPAGSTKNSPDGDGVYYDDLKYLARFGTPAGADTAFSGLVDLYMRESTGGIWAIYKWEDKRDDTTNRTLAWLRREPQLDL